MRVLLFPLVCGVLLSALPAASFAASSFEKSLAGFPESYRVILREVHKKHPKWVFKAMQTGLSFPKAVAAENSGNNSLVPASTSYSYIFKSHANGDYNASSGTYIQKDGGFCNANKYAVSYFMDPRNHFTDGGIFQFEDLSFDPSFNVDAIEVVLAGTFMHKTKPTYYTSSGATKTSDETYAEMMYAAGKASNINPCYLASKIRSEIGSTPSGSVTGRNSSYPGIYNFYNIGATDGAGAITRGLAWAANKTAGTYHRPWTSPKKSIIGGAEFLAATYIGQGQFTGYLQRFNVNPDSNYPVYQHQYMTCLSGAAEQSYSSYYTYLSNGLIDNAFIFSIPVYEDMTGEKDNSGSLYTADAEDQTAAVALSFDINVRKGPSQNYDTLGITLAPGTKVRILDTSFTDTFYYDSILRYPNWYRIRVKQNGETYTGWVPCGFMKITSSVTVGRGNYTPPVAADKGLEYRYVSLTPNTVTVVDDTSLKFTSTGNARVIAYDSTGRFAILNYTVSAKAVPQTTTKPPTTQPTTKPTTTKPTTTKPTTTKPPATQQPTQPAKPTVAVVQNLRQTDAQTDAVTINWNAVPGATGYRVYRYDSVAKSFQPILTTSKTTCTLKGLSVGESVMFKVKAYLDAADGKTYWSEPSAALTAVTVPQAPASFKQTDSASDTVSLSWKAVAGASSYQVFRYDNGTKAFQKILTTAQTTCTVAALSPNSTYRFKVRALCAMGSSTVESELSAERKAYTGPEKVTGLTQYSTTADSYRLTWNAVDNAAGYKVYRIEPQTYAFTLVGKTDSNRLRVTDVSAGQLDVYVVKAYRKAGDFTSYGSNSDEYLAAACPAKVKGVAQAAASSSSIDLHWQPVSNASGYTVYRYNGAEWKKISTVTGESATVKSLPSGSIVKFRIRAFIRLNEQVLWGDYSSTFNGSTLD